MYMNLQIEMYASDAKQDILSTTLLYIVVYLKKSCNMSVCLPVFLSVCLLSFDGVKPCCYIFPIHILLDK